MLVIICFYCTSMGVGSRGAAVWRALMPFDAACFWFNGAVQLLPNSGHFFGHIEVLEVGPKSAPQTRFVLFTLRAVPRTQLTLFRAST